MKSIIHLTIKRILLLVILICGASSRLSAQETYGNTLNLGLGIGYYWYANHSVPVLHANYEFNVAKNFTLAPFITYYSYRSDYYWGDPPGRPYRYYSYRETVVPIGVKGTYYFDDVLHANSKWDFYLGLSLGAALVHTYWDEGYGGDRHVYRNIYSGTSPIYLDAHIGAEYHISNRAGLFLDLSTGVSTLGVAIH